MLRAFIRVIRPLVIGVAIEHVECGEAHMDLIRIHRQRGNIDASIAK